MKADREDVQDFINWTKLKIKINFRDDVGLYFKEREIWWAGLGKNIGDEQDGKNEKFERPILILKNFNNKVLWTLPLTTRNKKGKYYYKINYMNEDFVVILSQLRLISVNRLLRKIRTLSKKEFEEIKIRVKSFL